MIRCPHSCFLPSGKVLMAVYRTARVWIFNGRRKRHLISTSHKYLFSTFLPASAFIYLLFGNFVWLHITHTHTQLVFQPVDGRRIGESFLVCFLHSMRATFTHYPRSQSQLWAFRSEEMQKEEWNKKRKTEQKNAYERLNSVLRDIT